MKRFLVLSFLLTAFIFSYAQNITDGNMDNWSAHSSGAGTYYEPINGWLMTLNELATVPVVVGGPGPITAERTSDVYQGSYAAKLTSKIFNVGGVLLFIPGTIGTINLDIVNQTLRTGRTYTYPEKPRRFKGYYKYAPVNNDSCLILTLLTRYNTSLHQRDTIAMGRQASTGTLSTYTAFNIEIIYRDTVTTPDTVIIILASSGFLNFTNFRECHGQLNSTMYVDELSFSMVNGIDMPVNPSMNVNIYPNPAVNTITFSTEKPLRNGIIEIYDINGKHIRTKSIDGSLLKTDVSGFAPGKYFYTIHDKKQLLNSGGFSVSR